MNLKPEMTLDKLQLIATAVVSSNFKVRWLTWWNSGVHTRSASWLNRAAFWTGVSTSFCYVDSNLEL
jgi:hypothetical protein